MDGRRTALIVASDEFEHAGLSRLQAPLADAAALAGVLGDPEIGGFAVEVVHNAPSHTVQARVEDLFAEGRPDDLLLLHFSGHGLKSDSGELFLAATNTRPDRLASTAVSADFVQRCMRGSRARSIVLFLDCCYGGAFGEGVAVRAAGPANVLDAFPAGKLGGGRGRAVITASSAMEYAFEGSALASTDQAQPSVFTSALVEGLSSGAADRDEDGLVSLTELYDYVFDQVRTRNPNQTPSRDIELQGELYVARSRRRRVRAVPLPPDLHAAVQDVNMYTRLGAVGELRARLASDDPGVALGAREALETVARSDTSYVADAARDALATGTPSGPTEPGPAAPSSTRPDHGYAAPAPAAPVPTAQVPTAPRSPGAGAGVPVASVPAPAPTDESAATGAPSARPRRRSDRGRVPAGRTMIIGGGLMALSALLPDFVDSASADTLDTALAVGLLFGGLAGAALGVLSMVLGALRPHWRWPVVAASLTAAVPLVVVIDALRGHDHSALDLGIWVALFGCLTAMAAGVVALAGLRAPTGRSVVGVTATAEEETEAEAQPVLVRVVGTGAIVASACMLLATFAVRFRSQNQALFDDHLTTNVWGFAGLVGLAAGTLTLRRRSSVGPALVAGAGAGAIWPLGGMPHLWKETGTSNLDAGYFLELLGLLGLCTLGVLALVLLRRWHGLALARPAGALVAAVGTVSLATAIPFVHVAGWDADGGRTGFAVHDALMALLVVLVPSLAAVLRPEMVGRVLLLGWSIATAGAVVDYWLIRSVDEYPLSGIPYVLLPLVAYVTLAVVGPNRRKARPA